MKGKRMARFTLYTSGPARKTAAPWVSISRDRLSQAVSPRVLQKFENRILIVAERLRHRSTQLVACKDPALRNVNG